MKYMFEELDSFNPITARLGTQFVVGKVLRIRRMSCRPNSDRPDEIHFAGDFGDEAVSGTLFVRYESKGTGSSEVPIVDRIEMTTD